MAGTTYSVAGLIIDIVGVWFVAYDIVVGYYRHNQASDIEHKLFNARRWARDFESKLLALPQPYDMEAKTKLVLEHREKWAESIDRLENEIQDLLQSHKDRSFNWTWVGLLLLTVGFALQAYGTLHP